jgi:hypothetical protein
MQIVIFIIIKIIIIMPLMMHSKSYYLLSRLPCNFVNISPEPHKGKRTSVSCFSWYVFLQIFQFFHAIGENHAELQSTELETYGLVQCIKLCVYSHKHAVKTQQISQIVSLYNKQHYVMYNNYMFRPCKRAIIRLFTEPSNRLHNRSLGGRDLVLHNS